MYVVASVLPICGTILVCIQHTLSYNAVLVVVTVFSLLSLQWSFKVEIDHDIRVELFKLLTR